MDLIQLHLTENFTSTKELFQNADPLSASVDTPLKSSVKCPSSLLALDTIFVVTVYYDGKHC